MKIRYIKNSIMGSNLNGGNHFVEIKALNYSNTNIALGKQVIANFTTHNGDSLNRVTDNLLDVHINSSDDNYSYEYVQVDLESLCDINEVKIWHYYQDGRRYKNNIVQVSENGTDWITVFDSNIDGEYVETIDGKSIFLIDHITSLPNDASLADIVAKSLKTSERISIYVSKLADNLKNKNVSVVENDTLKTLIDKVSNIAIGKKFSHGVSTSSSIVRTFAYSSGNETGSYYIDLPKLDFSPSFVFIVQNYTHPSASFFSKEQEIVLSAEFTMQLDTKPTTNWKADSKVSEDNFKYYIPFRKASVPVTWYAFE